MTPEKKIVRPGDPEPTPVCIDGVLGCASRHPNRHNTHMAPAQFMTGTIGCAWVGPGALTAEQQARLWDLFERGECIAAVTGECHTHGKAPRDHR